MTIDAEIRTLLVELFDWDLTPQDLVVLVAGAVGTDEAKVWAASAGGPDWAVSGEMDYAGDDIPQWNLAASFRFSVRSTLDVIAALPTAFPTYDKVRINWVPLTEHDMKDLRWESVEHAQADIAAMRAEIAEDQGWAERLELERRYPE